MSDKQVKFVVSSADKEWLTGVAKLAGVSLSSFIRQAVMKRAHKVLNIGAPVQEENERLRNLLLLHAGDTMSLSNELDEWRARALEAEQELAAVRRQPP